MTVKKVLTILFAAALVTATASAQQNPTSSSPQSSQSSTKKEEEKSGGDQQAGRSDQVKVIAMGDWELMVKLPDGESLPVNLTLQQEGETLTGSTTSQVFPTPAKIEDGKLTGDQFTFSVMVPDDSGSYKATMTGTISGDSVQGKVEARGNTMGFTGTRKKAATDTTAPISDKEKKETSTQKAP